VLKNLADNSIDSVVTDPPYELGFMGKSWDATGVAYSVELWQEVMRVLKPGGHLLAFSGSRTYHRMAVAIEDAGFEIRDQIMWIYGSGFPKSMNVSKAIEATLTTGSANKTQFKKLQGKKTKRRDANGLYAANEFHDNRPADYTEIAEGDFLSELEPTTIEAKQWQGWGTALKPAHEPIVVARKPLIGTVAANVLTYGTGGLNIDASRVGNEEIVTTNGKGFAGSFEGGVNDNGGSTHQGRWPANVIHDGSDEVVALFPTNTNISKGVRGRGSDIYANGKGFANTLAEVGQDIGYGDSGSAARFFYCAKASKRDRNEGLDGFEAKRDHDGRQEGGVGGSNPRNRTNTAKVNHHPTVKPTELMRYLCRLVTPPKGIVLDPFMGSGSTGKAAMYEGFEFIGIELTDEYLPIAKARIEFAIQEMKARLL
jgi:site-specific DNA-methyltransferase (adenine-specific)